ncbi:MAG: 2-oxo acid dehydrogenase subunit E2 [Bacillota bacterium]|jgi:hypothetical protein
MAKRHRGDRRDGTLIRDLDPLHFFTGIIYPNRCDNEAYISERIDLTPVNAYLARKNEGEDFPYTMFHLIVTAVVKTITLRPKLNRFIVNGNFYQRNEVSAAFVVKKRFNDESEEGLAFLHLKGEDTVDTIHEELRKIITDCRKEGSHDDTSESMDLISKLPRGLCKAFVHFVMFLDRHGRVPRSFVASDPYYASVVLSNVGSIRLKSGYHHLTNWGTCSLFCLVGERAHRPFFDADGGFEMKDTVDLGLTIDERLADGYYYAKSVRLLKTLLEHPELLEKPLAEEVEY